MGPTGAKCPNKHGNRALFPVHKTPILSGVPCDGKALLKRYGKIDQKMRVDSQWACFRLPVSPTHQLKRPIKSTRFTSNRLANNPNTCILKVAIYRQSIHVSSRTVYNVMLINKLKKQWLLYCPPMFSLMNTVAQYGGREGPCLCGTRHPVNG